VICERVKQAFGTGLTRRGDNLSWRRVKLTLSRDVPNEKKAGACSTPRFTTSQQRGWLGGAGEFAAHHLNNGGENKATKARTDCDLSTVPGLASLRIDAPDEPSEFFDIDDHVVVIAVGAEL